MSTKNDLNIIRDLTFNKIKAMSIKTSKYAYDIKKIITMLG